MIRVGNLLSIVLLLAGFAGAVLAQPPDREQKPKVRTMTIPISIFTKSELKSGRPDEYVQAATLTVHEDKDNQEILSLRSVTDVPLSIAVVIQDDLASSANLQLKSIANFIRGLPENSRVMVAYIRGGSLIVRQRFTTDRAKAADSLRILTSSGSATGNGPYGGIYDAVKRFDALPTGRRAILLVSDGFDATLGSSPSSVTQVPDLDRAIYRAQRNGVAVYSFYQPSTLTEGTNSRAALAGQAGLDRLADETGGRSYAQGTLAPISFEPFFKDLNMVLGRQFSLTYLSTHMKKGYHRLEVTSTNPEVKIGYPKGYYYR